MDDKLDLLQAVLGDNRIKTNIDISSELKTGLGGIVEGFYIATSQRELLKAIETCRELNIKFVVFGSGSKIALGDKAISPGLFIKNRSDNLKISGIKGKVAQGGIKFEEAFLEAESGVSLKRLAEFADQQNLTGMEIFNHTLGTVGGCLLLFPAITEKVYQVKVLAENGALITQKLEEIKGTHIILAVIFKLKAK